ncbi:MAG TPA: class I mannose-6-phosphate isomerase [Candidatus Faecalibacterium faecigallinarum]|uniref:Phosphohexomutase n=1 Tax=Candidatus Faecalibacterium faecigallinarum TaxID=2838577 RepID=A0A9D2T553_9FIRM|nr:class I mannose-6-phosphate isomerase [Candidatus Faecalibacterium faecigallinarum]
METIKLTPACKDYLWGGEKLRQDYGIQSQLHPLAEAWVLSCHPDGPSVVATGPLAGKTLPEYIQEKGPGCLGADCEKFTDFPILAKFIDAKGDLSIQVHPSNEYALAHEHQFGKTEMWYVLDCEPGATLYYGFQHQISREEFQQRIQDNTLTEVLNAVPVEKGDLFFIPAGTLHAIRKGIVVAEIQQNSNVTYRIYDYGRVGADGKPRQLHIQQALEVTQRTPPQPDPDFHGHLAQCPYFTVDVMEGRFTLDCGPESFVSVLVLEGTGALWEGDESMSLRKGESLFIPAGAGQCRLEGDGLKCLVTRV